jgi:hypothetical protein
VYACRSCGRTFKINRVKSKIQHHIRKTNI